MIVFTRFWAGTILWTGVILVPLTLVSGITGGAGAVLDKLALWVGFAFMLAAFPAGIRVSGDVFPTGHSPDGLGSPPGLDLKRVLIFLGTALSAVGATYALINWIGPALIAPVNPPETGIHGSSGHTLAQMLERLQVLSDAIPEGSDSAADWFLFNDLAYSVVRRTDGIILPFLFASVGLLTGFWSSKPLAKELRSTVQWGVGVVLLMTTYLAGENGYEMIVIRAGGPAEFSADLVLIVPLALIIGLGVPTLVSLYTRRQGSH